MKYLILALLTIHSFNAFSLERTTTITVVSATTDGVDETLLNTETGEQHSLYCHQGSLGKLHRLLINALPHPGVLQAVHDLIELQNMEECEKLKEILLGLKDDEKVTIVGTNGKLKKVLIHK